MEPTRLPRCLMPLMYGSALVIRYFVMTASKLFDKKYCLIFTRFSDNISRTKTAFAKIFEWEFLKCCLICPTVFCSAPSVRRI